MICTPKKRVRAGRKSCAQKTRQLVQKHRSTIANAAEILMQQGTVPLEEIDAMIVRVRSAKLLETLRAKLPLFGDKILN